MTEGKLSPSQINVLHRAVKNYGYVFCQTSAVTAKALVRRGMLEPKSGLDEYQITDKGREAYARVTAK